MNETTTLENAKALHAICKEKGVEMRESKYIAYDKHDSSGIIEKSKEKSILPVFSIWNAYTTNELLEWLPAIIGKNRLMLQKGLMGNLYYTIFFNLQTNEENMQTKAQTPQDALCHLLIELIKKEIIK